MVDDTDTEDIFEMEDGENSEDNDLPDLQEVSDEDDDNADEVEAAYNNSSECSQARRHMKKDEQTADLRTIFTAEKGHINVHTGEVEDGWWCDICK